MFRDIQQNNIQYQEITGEINQKQKKIIKLYDEIKLSKNTLQWQNHRLLLLSKQDSENKTKILFLKSSQEIISELVEKICILQSNLCKNRSEYLKICTNTVSHLSDITIQKLFYCQQILDDSRQNNPINILTKQIFDDSRQNNHIYILTTQSPIGTIGMVQIDHTHNGCDDSNDPFSSSSSSPQISKNDTSHPSSSPMGITNTSTTSPRISDSTPHDSTSLSSDNLPSHDSTSSASSNNLPSDHQSSSIIHQVLIDISHNTNLYLDLSTIFDQSTPQSHSPWIKKVKKKIKNCNIITPLQLFSLHSNLPTQAQINAFSHINMTQLHLVYDKLYKSIQHLILPIEITIPELIANTYNRTLDLQKQLHTKLLQSDEYKERQHQKMYGVNLKKLVKEEDEIDQEIELFQRKILGTKKSIELKKNFFEELLNGIDLSLLSCDDQNGHGIDYSLLLGEGLDGGGLENSMDQGLNGIDLTFLSDQGMDGIFGKNSHYRSNNSLNNEKEGNHQKESQKTFNQEKEYEIDTDFDPFASDQEDFQMNESKFSKKIQIQQQSGIFKKKPLFKRVSTAVAAVSPKDYQYSRVKSNSGGGSRGGIGHRK